MFELPVRVRDADTGSLLNWQAPRSHAGSDGNGDGGGSGPLAVGCLVAVLSSVAVSVVAHGTLPSTMRIHWSFGLGPYYGPEFAPTTVVLGGFSLLVTATALGAYWIGARLRRHDAFASVRPYYVMAMLGTLGSLLVTQVLLVVANA